MHRSDSRRSHRLGDQVMREVATMLIEDVSDPRIEMVTVSGVRMNKDLSIAEILYTIPGGEEAQKDAAKGLRKAAGFMRSLLGRRLRSKFVPELRFVYDSYLEDMVYDHPQNND
ncbi:30S ribosome-binding factor RbfA [Desulfobaculum bizertense]|uniref:Ribosome-binding factor A n=1 Tax=Desulfobaculum bizertense DSM 18034 TaxID=1121442 RepID=A0A1T4W795_9BACT|nr:30S ribosome-binding factor RbfA [Desulfobaculum bizertense]UIJ39056.1 30S ribosome-binding factor RbfA [Desulfobaculum bizertense]SKA72908.1 ribosome-binding factor A [Desulfobaculum bizertense DSM 18034]